jgi:hypothetical protein
VIRLPPLPPGRFAFLRPRSPSTLIGAAVVSVVEPPAADNPQPTRHIVLLHARCRCFGSDRTPGVAPQGVFRGRTVSTTVAKWFVPDARGTMNKVYRFGPLRDA